MTEFCGEFSKLLSIYFLNRMTLFPLIQHIIICMPCIYERPNSRFLKNIYYCLWRCDVGNFDNPFWPSDATWRHRSGSTLAQAVTAPSHYRNQCWLIIKGLLRHLPGIKFWKLHFWNHRDIFQGTISWIMKWTYLPYAMMHLRLCSKIWPLTSVLPSEVNRFNHICLLDSVLCGGCIVYLIILFHVLTSIIFYGIHGKRIWDIVAREQSDCFFSYVDQANPFITRLV